MTPIGGGYTLETLQGFARAAANGATGPTVDIVVVPSSYGDAPADRAENLALAQERTDQVDAACDGVVTAPFTGCTAVLAPLLNRADADDPANSSSITEQTDGLFILGGDQGLAMSILADSPAEAAMQEAFERGAAVGGTSAGAAVESRTMINGYVGDLGPWDGLRQGSSLIWWGDDGDRERGLSFGSTRAIYDQHFYQRGRFGRLLSTLATSDEHFAGASKVGVGVDYATGIENTGDQTLSDVFGASSVAVLDLESLSSPITWVGPHKVLSTRNVVTHLLPPGSEDSATAYDLTTRTVTRAGAAVPAPVPAALPAPTVPAANGLVYLGGDVVGGSSSAVVSQFVGDADAAVAAGAQPRVVVLAASSKDKKATKAYTRALQAAGWSGKVEVIEQDKKSKVVPEGAAGTLLLGETPASVATAVADPAFAALVRSAVLTAPVVLADRHLTAALGTWFSTKADPTQDNYEDEAIANFRTGDGQWQRGLGLVTGSLVPSLTVDYRWGKLFDLGRLAPEQIAWGLGEDTAVRLVPGAQPSVVGDGSVVALDPRPAQFWTGPNGAIGAVNVLLDTFGAGEHLG
jgi:cyanophycinase